MAPDLEVDGLAPWDSDAVAAQQRAVADRELAAWLGGVPAAHFDALATCFRQALPASVLEVGCGSGYLSAVLARVTSVARYAGCDTSAAALRLARTRHPHHDFMSADQRRLPYLAGEFDAVVSGCCLIHLLPAEWPAAIAEAARVARRWVVFHKTPIRPNHYVAEVRAHAAYCVTMREACANATEYERQVTEAGLVVVQRHAWSVGQDPELHTWLCRKKW